MAEAFGVAGRGKFYEETGAIRDVVQNHLLQVVGFLAMEPPTNLYRRRAARRTSQNLPLHSADQTIAGRSRAIHRLSQGAGRCAGLQSGDIRRRAPRSRLLALGRRAVS